MTADNPYQTPPPSEPSWTVHDVDHDAGNVGGDEQVGPSSCRRFTFGPVACPNPTMLGIERRYLVVEDYYYAASWADPDDAPDDGGGPDRFWWQDQTVYTVCTDPDDPGGTALDSRHEYGEGSYVFFPSEQAATDDVRATAGRLLLDNFNHYDPTDDLKRGRMRADRW